MNNKQGFFPGYFSCGYEREGDVQRKDVWVVLKKSRPLDVFLRKRDATDLAAIFGKNGRSLRVVKAQLSWGVK